MTDLEMTRLCAEAMGLDVWLEPHRGTIMRYHYWKDNVAEQYSPLHDDAQAMALVKKFQLNLGFNKEDEDWVVESIDEGKEWCIGIRHDLNRAIVECVAKMQEKK